MRVPTRRWLFGSIAISAFLTVFIPPLPVQAVNGSLFQQILPLECVFQVVNDGSNTVIYITPEECGQLPPPDPDPEPEEPSVPDQPPIQPTRPVRQVVTRIETGSGIIQTPGLVIPNGLYGAAAGRELPYSPTANYEGVEAARDTQTLIASESTLIGVGVVGAIALLLILLIVLA